MIWIATLCLLCVAAWLILSAMNERQWVEAHAHDESVAADKGFLPDWSAAAKKLSLEDDNAPLAKAVTRVQDKTSGVGQRLGQVAHAAPANADDQEAAKYTGPTGADLVGSAVTKVGVNPGELKAKVKDKATASLDNHKRKPGLTGKVANNIAGWVDRS